MISIKHDFELHSQNWSSISTGDLLLYINYKYLVIDTMTVIILFTCQLLILMIDHKYCIRSSVGIVDVTELIPRPT